MKNLILLAGGFVLGIVAYRYYLKSTEKTTVVVNPKPLFPNQFEAPRHTIN